MNDDKFTRRDFLKATIAGSSALAASTIASYFGQSPLSSVEGFFEKGTMADVPVPIENSIIKIVKGLKERAIIIDEMSDYGNKEAQKDKDLLNELATHFADNGLDLELYNSFALDKMHNVLRNSGSDLAHHFAPPPDGSGRKMSKSAKTVQKI